MYNVDTRLKIQWIDDEARLADQVESLQLSSRQPDLATILQEVSKERSKMHLN